VNADEGQYTAFIERSPKGNYLYYISAQGSNHLIQYNTNTGEKKIIAELSVYHYNKYNFSTGRFFGGALNSDGSSIFLVCLGYDGKNRAGFFHVHIPQSERSLETDVDTGTVIIPDTLGNKSHHILSTSVEGKGSVNPMSGFISEGTDITLTATAADGWRFDKWTGDMSDTTRSVTATMNTDVSLTANFVELPEEISAQNNTTNRFYPNPVTDKLTIELHHGFSQGKIVQLFDNTGRLIINNKVQGTLHILEMEDLSPGIYLIKVSDIDQNCMMKYIVKR
jgi:hypothetical protein